MNKALADYLAELESQRYSGSRLTHVRRTIEMLMLYLKEAHQLADWRAVNESHLRGFAVFSATRHRTNKGQSGFARHAEAMAFVRSRFLRLDERERPSGSRSR